MQFKMPLSSSSCQKQLPAAASRLKAFVLTLKQKKRGKERKKEKVLTELVGGKLYAIP